MAVSIPETDDDALPISGLQHLAFCPRQWALIHLEQVWVENRRTAEGRLLHERADLPGESRRAGVRTVRGMWLRSERLRLTGRADIVEFHADLSASAGGNPRSDRAFPVEYKRGRKKPTDCDAIQLCAQALCLEEMLQTTIAHGAIFYGDPRRRLQVDFTPQLRSRTEELAVEEMGIAVKSPPTRGAWIETARAPGCSAPEGVAPHAGGVD